MSGYPDGCTQATHDAAFNNALEPSAAIEREAREAIEARALGEILLRTKSFVDWLGEQDSVVLAAFVALCFYPTSKEFIGARHALAAKYLDYRVSVAQSGDEWDKEIAKAMA